MQQGAELAYLLLRDPEFHSKARREHLHMVGKQIRLKKNIELLYQISGPWDSRLSLRVLRAVGCSGGGDTVGAPKGLCCLGPYFQDGDFDITRPVKIDTVARATAGYGKVAALDRHCKQVCESDRITSCMWATAVRTCT